jgi:hypothetical protein
MPKRLMLVLCVAALAVAACHGSSSTTPTPSFSPGSPAPNPSIRTAHVLVTINGVPKSKIPVQESTPKSTSSPRPGQPFETRSTGRSGKVKFTGLKPAKTYCWVAILPKGESFECAGWEIWQSSIITLGT